MEIIYDLFELPTAQHKAGLAGLLLMIQSMKERKIAPVPEVKKITPTSVIIEFTKENLQSLFDDLYDAARVETKVSSKWANAEPKRIEEETVATEKGEKKQKYFIYDVVQPKGAFLSYFYEDKDAWIKLWRDMLWNIMRARPATRGDYERRANGKELEIADKIWKSLLDSEKNRKKGKIKIESIASSIFIGAQDVNAEKVPFQGPTEYNLLLHFWQLAILIYVPRKISLEGDRKSSGYVMVIPEPSDIESFKEVYKDFIDQLSNKIIGYRPEEALIDLPEEGGLEYLYHLSKAKVKEKEISYTINSVELYHLEKRGNNIHMLASERIIPDKDILTYYELYRTEFYNPFYKCVTIKNLLSGDLWFSGFEDIFNQYPSHFFVYKKGKTPYKISFFGSDVKKKFKAINDEMRSNKGGMNNMSDKEREGQLAQRVNRLIRTYISKKTEEKSGITYDDFKKSFNDKYRETREKVCTDAFLAMRGRREQDFIEYFTGTICSVPQFLPENDYLEVANALLNEWEKVKTLSMLSVSACSYLSEPKDNLKV